MLVLSRTLWAPKPKQRVFLLLLYSVLLWLPSVVHCRRLQAPPQRRRLQQEVPPPPQTNPDVLDGVTPDTATSLVEGVDPNSLPAVAEPNSGLVDAAAAAAATTTEDGTITPDYVVEQGGLAEQVLGSQPGGGGGSQAAAAAAAATNWNSQEEEEALIAEYGGLFGWGNGQVVDDAGQPNCGYPLNASKSVCDRLIAKSSNLTCQCYNFCNGGLHSCYDYGDVPSPSTREEGGGCEIESMVLGCRVNYTEPFFNNTSSEPEPCPEGFMCSRDDMTSCETIRAIPLLFNLGDVHAGMYCPGSDNRNIDNGYKLCEPGYYCVNSTSKEKCPAGYFCPHKTAFPQISCKTCPEGAESLQREEYGYIATGVAMLLLVLFLIWRAFLGYNKEVAQQLADLQKQGAHSVRSKVMFLQQKKKLQALRPKLQVIEKRMKSNTNLHASTAGLSTERENGDIQFNAHKLFDALDEDKNGSLSYKELNNVLMLEPAALREFTNRMNQAAKEPPGTNTISRPVFVRFFLTALEASSHFEPTPQECAALYDQLSLEAKAHGFDTNGGIPFEAFYKCESIAFLTEPQIHNLLSKLETCSGNHDETDEAMEQATAPNSSMRSSMGRQQTVANFFGAARFSRRVARNTFIARYPKLLLEVTDEHATFEKEGVDIAFQNLSLTVKKGDKDVKVVNDVTGRLRAGTMTALMGGSGAGKTSLLNALCGRAHYGDVTGNIKINGKNSSIEEHADSVGFVPQDDIVFAELTVRENLIYAGKFQLPRGTSIQEIEDLADKSLAGLGLSRVQHNMVGDVNRRGVSGGEKKRVNIGLELMSRPKILFLDEPTSGLDSSSAMLVMQSMKTLVEVQGITVCSVIHQPRKTIFELFDSLVLLGAGGFVVYHGKVKKAHKYFWKLGYDLPEGESLADWLIDISTGCLKPEVFDDDSDYEEEARQRSSKKEKKKKKKKKNREPKPGTGFYNPSSDEEDYNGEQVTETTGFMQSLAGSEPDDPEMLASDEAKEAARREILYREWRLHFQRLSKKKKAAYDAPKPFDFPTKVQKPSFLSQLGYQVHRLVLLAWRNWYAKLLDTTIIVGAVILVSALDGVVTPTKDQSMDSLDYYAIAKPTLDEDGAVAFIKEFPKLFAYALRGNGSVVQYAAKLGVLIAVLVGLTATKTITEKRNEFFREAGSGYDINAYFAAVNVVSTAEHSLQVIFSSMVALWLRNSLAHWYSYYINFLLLAWLTVSWALLFPLLVQPKSVVLVTGFYCIFFSLLFSGGIDPIKYKDIYGSTAVALFSGLLSPTRYFIEAMAAAESKCLPVQSGFTSLGERLLSNPNAKQVASFQIVAQGLNDFGNIIQHGCNGWYWGSLPALAVGCLVRWVAAGINHVSGRAQQSKKSLSTTLARNKSSQCALSLYLAVLIALGTLSVWLILRKTS